MIRFRWQAPPRDSYRSALSSLFSGRVGCRDRAATEDDVAPRIAAVQDRRLPCSDTGERFAKRDLDTTVAVRDIVDAADSFGDRLGEASMRADLYDAFDRSDRRGTRCPHGTFGLIHDTCRRSAPPTFTVPVSGSISVT